MSSSLHILILEDNSSDVELMNIQLNKLKLDISVHTVAGKESFETFLKNRIPDLVICDYNLPGYNGLNAMQKVRDYNPEIPFILVTGYLKEEDAVNMMKKGASDIVIKDRLNRLGPAVQRELINYEERLASKEELQKSYTRFQALIQSVDGIVWEADARTFTFNYVSPQSLQIVGYKPEEWVETPGFLKNRIHPDDREGVVEYSRNKTEKGENYTIEYRMQRADGSYVWLRDVVTVITKEGKPASLCGLMINITREKELEVKLEQACKLAKFGNWEFNLETQILHWSKFVKDLHEVDGNFEPDLDTAIEFYEEGWSRDAITQAVENAVNEGTPFDVELKIITAKGKKCWVRAIGRAQWGNGTCKRLYGSIQDITVRKEAELELKESHAALTERVKEQKCLYSISNLQEQDLDIKQLLDKAVKLIPRGLQFNEIAEARITWEEEIFETDNFSRTLYALEEETDISGGHRLRVEVSYVDEKCDFTENPFMNEERQLLKAITAQLSQKMDQILKREELQQTQQKLRNVVENSTNMFYQHNTEGVLSYVSPQSEQFLGVSPEDASRKWAEFITDHPVNKEGKKNTIRAIETGRVQPPYELQLKKADGTLVWVDVNEAPLVENGKTAAIVGSLTDITDRKIFEKELITTNEKLKTAQSIAKLGYWELDQQTNKIYWSDEVYQIWGRSAGEFDPTLESFMDTIHSDDREAFELEQDRALNGEKELDFVHRIYLPDGTVKWVHEKGNLVKNKAGLSIAFEGTVQDVTKDKQIEIELEAAFNEKVMILESIGDAFFALNKNWIVTYWNKEAENILGKPREEMIGKNLWDEYEDATRLAFYTQFQNAINEQTTVHFEEYYPALEMWFEVSAYPSGNGLSVFFKNVTERKEASMELEVAYKEKETILESIGDGFFTVDKNWAVTYWNRAAERMLETPKEAILGNNLWDVFADAVDLPSYTNYHRVMNEGEPVEFEDYYEALHKWFDVSAYPSPNGISVFFKNVTDEKIREEELKTSLKEKETLLAEIHHRVKNNLAVVSSLMQMQAASSDKPELKSHLMEGVLRIKSMAAIHEQLYQSKSFSRLQFSEGLRGLIENVVETLQTDTKVDLNFHLDSVELNINQGVPCSLLINEVLSNILKHGFKGRKAGRIDVELREKNRKIMLSIRDNGIGLPENFGKQQNKTMGLELIDLLTCQIDGKKEFVSGKQGTEFTLHFKKVDISGVGSAHMK